MSLLAVSVLAVLVGVLVIAFLVMRFAMKVMWKLAMIAVTVVILVIAAGAAYIYFEGSPVELPSLPALPSR